MTDHRDIVKEKNDEADARRRRFITILPEVENRHANNDRLFCTFVVCAVLLIALFTLAAAALIKA
jgi:hypothetical protein